jgi:hypothetical protein
MARRLSIVSAMKNSWIAGSLLFCHEIFKTGRLQRIRGRFFSLRKEPAPNTLKSTVSKCFCSRFLPRPSLPYGRDGRIGALCAPGFGAYAPKINKRFKDSGLQIQP